ncbi:hypothetical protein SUGI_0899620 [Cryptomeria japonica]|nr:hypothetical protein SUGI_0899620 [Cryptomeria japonica]
MAAAFVLDILFGNFFTSVVGSILCALRLKGRGFNACWSSTTLTKDVAADTLLLRPPAVLSLPPVKLSLATQPGYGVNVTRIFLLANHFWVRFQNNELYQYDPPKGCSYSVIMETFKQQAIL